MESSSKVSERETSKRRVEPRRRMTLSSGSAGQSASASGRRGKSSPREAGSRRGMAATRQRATCLPALEARRAVDLADRRVVDLPRGQRLGLEVQHGGVRRRRWRLGRSPERNEGNSPFPSRVESEQVLDVAIRETCDDLGCEPLSGGHRKQVRVERSTVPEDMAVGSFSVLPGVAPVGRGARDDDRRPSQRRLDAGSLDERASVVTDTQPPKRGVVRAEVVDARWKIREVTAGEIEVDVVESARVRCRPEGDVAAGGAPDLRDPGRVVEDAGERLEDPALARLARSLARPTPRWRGEPRQSRARADEGAGPSQDRGRA